VVILEPVGVVRASLQMVLGAERDLEVLGAAEDPDEGLALVVELRRHERVVVLVGLEFVGQRDSFWLIRAIRDRSPELVILASGTDLDHSAISQALFMGADGFVHKNSTPERFVEATRRAAAGELVLEGLPRGALGGIVDQIDSKASGPTLTEREQTVLATAAEGLTAREIGRRLGVSERTVTTHLNNIYRKLGANGRVSAVSAALRIGVLKLPDADGQPRIAVS
jgi:DNA-binding NarL/FixJ family response regulator